jgi:hypothetical protein
MSDFLRSGHARDIFEDYLPKTVKAIQSIAQSLKPKSNLIAVKEVGITENPTTGKRGEVIEDVLINTDNIRCLRKRGDKYHVVFIGDDHGWCGHFYEAEGIEEWLKKEGKL